MLAVEDRINTKRDLKEWLSYERNKYGIKNGVGGMIREMTSFSESGILSRHQVLLRKTEYHMNNGHKILSQLYRLKLRRMQNHYGIHIHPNTCGRGLRLMHLGPILMNGRVTVGRDCCFHVNTAVVAGGTNDDVPCLGNDITVGIGAVILGGIKIASYVAIGANALVNKDFTEENIAVAGVPAKKISNNGTTEWNKKAKEK